MAENLRILRGTLWYEGMVMIPRVNTYICVMPFMRLAVEIWGQFWSALWIFVINVGYDIFPRQWLNVSFTFVSWKFSLQISINIIELLKCLNFSSLVSVVEYSPSTFNSYFNSFVLDMSENNFFHGLWLHVWYWGHKMSAFSIRAFLNRLY